LNLDGFAQSGDVLSLHSDDNKIYIDESLFNCWINDGSGAREIKYEWYVGAAVAGIKAPGLIKAIGTALAPSAPQVAETINNVDTNKLNHIFNKIEHNLDPLVNYFGSQTAAFNAVQQAAQAQVTANGLTGIFDSANNPIIVNVGRQVVHVGGSVIDGVLKVGTFFIP